MSEHDPINSPSHYTQGEIQPIEAIEDWKLGFNLGNAVKYIARAGKKDPSKTAEDLGKARYYLNREIAGYAIPNDESSEMIMETIHRISMATGYNDVDVVSTALWLYQEAIQAKFDGRHAGISLSSESLTVEWHGLFDGDDGESEEEEEAADEPEPFKPGDKVMFAIKEESPSIGVVREIRHDKTYYVVDWKEEDGTEWDDQHYAHELVACETEAVYPDDPSKTVTCYRCTSCGMPIVAGDEIRSRDIFDGPLTFHKTCFYGDIAEAEAKNQPKPKFAVGDKVVFTSIGAECVGVVKKIIPSGYVETGYEVALTAKSGRRVFESELKPFEDKPAEPKFEPGDRVHDGSGYEALVYESSLDSHGDECLGVFWLNDRIHGTLKARDAVLVKD